MRCMNRRMGIPLAHHLSAWLLATYGDYAWNVLNDCALGERMAKEAVHTRLDEQVYQITLIRMLAVQRRNTEAK